MSAFVGRNRFHSSIILPSNKCIRIFGNMTSTRQAFNRNTVALIASVAMIASLLLYVVDLSIVQRDHFLACRGPHHEVAEAISVSRSDNAVITEVLLVSSCGLQVRLKALVPVEAKTGKVPSLLLLGGHRTGRNAVDLVDQPQGIVYASIDYPYAGSHSLSGASQITAAVPGIQKAFLDTPPALMLAMDWLSDQSWFDSARAELAGVSLGVPFAAVAGALDQRFSRVWLIHGATDNYEWLKHAAEGRVKNRVLRSMAVRTSLLLAYGNSFRTADWLREIAPRPVVLVAARNDERMPPKSPEASLKAAEDAHVSIVWTEGQHIGPGREYELQQLIELVVEQMHASQDNAGVEFRPTMVSAGIKQTAEYR